MNNYTLDNNIPVVINQNKNTPRVAMCLYFKIEEPEKKAGLYTLLNRLFLQGTKTRSAEALAQELDENGIDCYSEMKHDFIRFKLQCLNEDFAKGIEILEDIVKNSTLADFEKEVIKMKGEIQAELDDSKTRALDGFFKNIYKDHPYGHTYTKVLEDIDSITFAEVESAYRKLLLDSTKVISLVGDIESEVALNLLKRHFNSLANNLDSSSCIPEPVLTKTSVVK